MATEVLRPQDCLIGSHPGLGYPRRRSVHGGVSNSRINRRSSNKVGSQSEQGVTILRRGETVDGRPRRNLCDVYAGSAFLSTSPPPPSSLPLPSFTPRRMVEMEVVVVDDSATRDLRRLLRLE